MKNKVAQIDKKINDMMIQLISCYNLNGYLTNTNLETLLELIQVRIYLVNYTIENNEDGSEVML